MKKIINVALTLALLAALLVSLACAPRPEKAVIGTWLCQENYFGIVTEVSYKFNDDGTGSMSSIAGLQLAFDYEFSDEKLTITTTTFGIQKANVYSYTFEKEKLTLVDGSTVLELVKQK